MVLSFSIWGADFNSPALQLLNQFPRGGMVHIECNGSQVWKLADLLFTDVCDIEVHLLGVDLVVHLQFLPHIEFRDVLRQGMWYLQVPEKLIGLLDVWLQTADGLFL